MKRILLIITVLSLASPTLAQSELDDYLKSYSYASRKDMKVSNEQIKALLLEGKALLVDIRFAEEQKLWQFNHATKIPLNKLPTRLDELPKDQLIVAACPHKDRAIMAMMYLKSKGYQAAYLKEGLLGLMESLRGEKAEAFDEALKKKEE